jgi:hypothetical protein
MPTPLTNALSISDTTLLPNVKYAFHALALHENRDRFNVTLFKANKQDIVSGKQILKQVRMPVHLGVSRNVDPLLC